MPTGLTPLKLQEKERTTIPQEETETFKAKRENKARNDKNHKKERQTYKAKRKRVKQEMIKPLKRKKKL
jgi:hypothetical protein